MSTSAAYGVFVGNTHNPKTQQNLLGHHDYLHWGTCNLNLIVNKSWVIFSLW